MQFMHLLKLSRILFCDNAGSPLNKSMNFAGCYIVCGSGITKVFDIPPCFFKKWKHLKNNSLGFCPNETELCQNSNRAIWKRYINNNFWSHWRLGDCQEKYTTDALLLKSMWVYRIFLLYHDRKKAHCGITSCCFILRKAGMSLVKKDCKLAASHSFTGHKPTQLSEQTFASKTLKCWFSWKVLTQSQPFKWKKELLPSVQHSSLCAACFSFGKKWSCCCKTCRCSFGKPQLNCHWKLLRKQQQQQQQQILLEYSVPNRSRLQVKVQPNLWLNISCS